MGQVSGKYAPCWRGGVITGQRPRDDPCVAGALAGPARSYTCDYYVTLAGYYVMLTGPARSYTCDHNVTTKLRRRLRRLTSRASRAHLYYCVLSTNAARLLLLPLRVRYAYTARTSTAAGAVKAWSAPATMRRSWEIASRWRT